MLQPRSRRVHFCHPARSNHRQTTDGSECLGSGFRRLSGLEFITLENGLLQDQDTRTRVAQTNQYETLTNILNFVPELTSDEKKIMLLFKGEYSK